MGLALAVKRVWRLWDVERVARRNYASCFMYGTGIYTGALWFGGRAAIDSHVQEIVFAFYAAMLVVRWWAWRGIERGVRVDAPTVELRGLWREGARA